jgi:3-phosphoshikimate 1-carboxyvinyltransferase
MYLRVYPSEGLVFRTRRVFVVPSSKPETQRALLLAALANGRSEITHDLRCRETYTMRRALQSLGAVFIENKDRLTVDGVSLRNRKAGDAIVIQCEGSGLVARVFTVLGMVGQGALLITGDHILRRREMTPLFEAVQKANQSLEYLGDPYHLPVLVRGGGMRGGDYELPGDVSSQFITALLIGAPMAESPLTIHVRGPVFSGSYLRQTIAAMKTAGVYVACDETLKWFRAPTTEYQPFTQRILGDCSSASYLLAAAALSQGATVLRNICERTLQGEWAMIRMLEEMGVECVIDAQAETVTVQNRHESLKGDYEFDVRDCPNIVPTLAALGSFVNGVFRVVGASITRLHKSPRVDAMVSELRKLGVNITTLFRKGLVDGFEVRGANSYEGGQTLSSWQDHRIFMSLFVASLRHRKPNLIDGFADVDCSFPGFFEQFQQNGATFDVVEQPESRS